MVVAAAPRLIHSEDDSLSLISPFMGPSFDPRLPPPDGGLAAPPPAQLLIAAPFPPQLASATELLDSLQALICFPP